MIERPPNKHLQATRDDVFISCWASGSRAPEVHRSAE